MKMKCSLFVAALLGFILLPFVATITVTVKIHASYFTVTWSPASPIPDKYEVRYQVIGTGYHAVLELPGNESETNITTSDYPGSLYMIQLYTRRNNSNTRLTTRFARADCSHHVNTTAGQVHIVTSPGYPEVFNIGMVCQWSFYANNDTWYQVTPNVIDIGNITTCQNSLHITNNLTICGSTGALDPISIQNGNMDLTFISKGQPAGKGFNVTIEATHKLFPPRNISAIVIGEYIHVTWEASNHLTDTFSYIVSYSHFPYTSRKQLVIPQNYTSVDIDISRNLGQVFHIKAKTTASRWASAWTKNIWIKTDCDKRITLTASESVTVTSLHYPFGYLQGVHCQYTIHTDDKFYLRMDTTAIDISGADNCLNTYVEVKGLGKFCKNSPPPSSFVIKKNTLMIEFYSSANSTSGKGFNITFKSVAIPTDSPNHVKASVGRNRIAVNWEAPITRSQYITGYIVEYSVVPSVDRQTLTIGADKLNTSLNTTWYPGTMFIIRLAALTEGGQSPFTMALYARASCGSDYKMNRHQSAVIISPTPRGGKYQPGCFCRWRLHATAPLWMRVHIKKLDLEDSVNCTKDYLDISDTGIFCGKAGEETFIIKHETIKITFLSDHRMEGKGFVLTVMAVGPAPGVPQSISVNQSLYSLVFSWHPPVFHSRYLSGYTISYSVRPSALVHTAHLPRQQTIYVLDSTSIPGRHVDFWVQSDGDVESSNKSHVISIRTDCGRRYDNIVGHIYITSPGYPNTYQPNVCCKWTIENTTGSNRTLTFIKLNMAQNRGTCGDNVTVSGHGSFCDDSVENVGIPLNTTGEITIEFRTDDTGNAAGFLLVIDILQDLTSPAATSSTRDLQQTSSRSRCQSTSVFCPSQVTSIPFQSPTTDLEVVHVYSSYQHDGTSQMNLSQLLQTTPSLNYISDTLLKSMHKYSSEFNSGKTLPLTNKSTVSYLGAGGTNFSSDRSVLFSDHGFTDELKIRSVLHANTRTLSQPSNMQTVSSQTYLVESVKVSVADIFPGKSKTMSIDIIPTTVSPMTPNINDQEMPTSVHLKSYRDMKDRDISLSPSFTSTVFSSINKDNTEQETTYRPTERCFSDVPVTSSVSHSLLYFSAASIAPTSGSQWRHRSANSACPTRLELVLMALIHFITFTFN